MSRSITSISRANASSSCSSASQNHIAVNGAHVFLLVCQQNNWALKDQFVKDEKTDKFVVYFREKADWNGVLNPPIMLKSQKWILMKHLL